MCWFCNKLEYTNGLIYYILLSFKILSFSYVLLYFLDSVEVLYINIHPFLEGVPT